jgi:hypothetical protein
LPDLAGDLSNQRGSVLLPGLPETYVISEDLCCCPGYAARANAANTCVPQHDHLGSSWTSPYGYAKNHLFPVNKTYNHHMK